MTATHEARPPRAILERAASAMSLRGVDPKHVPSTSPTKIRPGDWALAVAIACEEDPLSALCLRARWMGDESAVPELAVGISLEGRGRVKDKHLIPLAIFAARQYAAGDVSPRQIAKGLRICQVKTWPKMEAAFQRMISRAYRAEANLGRHLREMMY